MKRAVRYSVVQWCGVVWCGVIVYVSVSTSKSERGRGRGTVLLACTGVDGTGSDAGFRCARSRGEKEKNVGGEQRREEKRRGVLPRSNGMEA